MAPKGRPPTVVAGDWLQGGWSVLRSSRASKLTMFRLRSVRAPIGIVRSDLEVPWGFFTYEYLD
jgi:hypothetical protein